MNYRKDVTQTAIGFLEFHADDFKEAIMDCKEFERNNIRPLEESFHYYVTDRAYTPEDAIYILEHCENEETDSGRWEGLKDWRQELSTRAAYSYSLDVWFKTEEMYKELVDLYAEAQTKYVEERMNTHPELDEDDICEGRNDQDIINAIWKNYFEELEPTRVTPGSQEELELLEEWLSLNKNAGMWGSYPLGDSYIDDRSGSGHGMPEIKDYVDFDHEVAMRLPHMVNKRRESVEQRIEELKEKVK